MPLGSSSDAPVTRPGPRVSSRPFFVTPLGGVGWVGSGFCVGAGGQTCSSVVLTVWSFYLPPAAGFLLDVPGGALFPPLRWKT